MVSYLLLPRRGDVVKWIIFPIGFLVGAFVRGFPPSQTVAQAILVWACLELLIYQARYQWNDIRGFDSDQRHPDGEHGRLPGPPSMKRSRVTYSAVVAAAKVLGAVAICAFTAPRAAWAVVALTAAVFGVGALYEWLRSASTGWSETTPPKVTLGIVAVWLVVGAGYAIRAVGGLAMATSMDPRTLAFAVATAWLFGIGWVTSRWAVESLAYARLEAGQLVWTASKEDAKEHQLALAHWLPRRRAAHDQATDLRRWAAVRSGTSWSAPWNVAGTLAGGLATCTGVLVVEPSLASWKLPICALGGCLASSIVTAAGRYREVVTAAIAAAVVGLLAASEAREALLAALPWLAVSSAQACYLRQDRASMGQFMQWIRARDHRSRATSPVS